MQLKNILIILIILIIIIVIIICCRNLVLKDKNIYESFNYHKCNDIKVGRILNDVFVKNNIQKSSDNWDIYLPCGYNYVERELKTIKPQNTNQVIFGVSGCDSIVSKNRLWELIKTYYGRDKAKKIMPETWVLNDPEDMRLFMRNYDENNMYNVENWLVHHGEKLNNRFKLEAYIFMNHLLSTVDITRSFNSFDQIVKKIKSSIHLIAINSDLYFFSYQDELTYKKIKKIKKNIFYNEIKSIHGHDAFLIENEMMSNILKPIFNKK